MTTRMQYIVGFGLCGLTALKILPHTLFVKRYQDFQQQYNPDRTPVELRSHVERMTEQVLHDLKIPPVKKLDVKFFTSSSMDVSHMGSLNLSTGGIIGIPKTFAYNSLSDIEREKLVVRQQAIPWETEEGNQLEVALVLSEKAKKFAVAREMHYINSNYVWVDTMLTTGGVFMAYTLGAGTNNVLRLRERGSRGLRLSLYTFFSSVTFLMYLFAKDSYYNVLDVSSDKKAAETGRDYLEGGVEFYDKQLLKNSALRELLPNDEGKKWFTQFGNESALLRTPHFPLIGRRDRLKKLLEKQEQSEKEDLS